MDALTTRAQPALTDEILTMAEIETRYPDRWVLIDKPESNDMQEILRGKVVWHSEDRDEISRKIQELKSRRFGVIHTRGPAKDTVFIF